jgi:hypothetical protein
MAEKIDIATGGILIPAERGVEALRVPELYSPVSISDEA